jgi:lipoic acid synthetase
MGLTYVVVTSVTRDDLPDGGAAHYARTIHALQPAHRRRVHVEVLIPDFQGDREGPCPSWWTPARTCSITMWRPLRVSTPSVRPQAIYRRSLELLARAHEMNPDIPTKSGLMLGLGETDDEIREAFRDLLAADCRILTLGQYLQPTPGHLPVDRFVAPETFAALKAKALALGFEQVAAGPFVQKLLPRRRLIQCAQSKPTARSLFRNNISYKFFDKKIY